MKVFDLLEQKDFEQLNDVDKASVLEEMSEEEYREQRKIIVSAGLLFSNNSIRSELKAPEISKAKDALTQKKVKPLAKIISFRMPIWQVAAIIVCLLSFNYLMSSKEQEKKLYITNYVNRVVEEKQPVDTVYETIYKEAPNKTNTVRVQQVDSKVEINEAMEQNKIAMLVDFDKELESMNSSFGINMQQDSLTKKILGVIL